VTEKRTKTSLKEDCKIAWDMTSDGCSMSPDLAHKDCCDEHDHAYRNPPALTGVSRLQADNKLFKCMMKKYKTPIFPIIYWLGVRIGGCTAWRWGKKWTTDEEAEHQRLFGDEDI
jgi:hypothetical protein